MENKWGRFRHLGRPNRGQRNHDDFNNSVSYYLWNDRSGTPPTPQATMGQPVWDPPTRNLRPTGKNWGEELQNYAGNWFPDGYRMSGIGKNRS